MGTLAQLLADNLRFWRSQRDLTQESLATRIGVSTVAYQNWEAMRRWPSAEMLEATANALKVSPDELFADRTRILKPTLQEALAVLQDAVSKLESFRSHSKTGDELLDELEKETFGKTRQKKTHSGNDSSA